MRRCSEEDRLRSAQSEPIVRDYARQIAFQEDFVDVVRQEEEALLLAAMALIDLAEEVPDCKI
jgi:hypothetical protein